MAEVMLLPFSSQEDNESWMTEIDKLKHKTHESYR
jgi:hypothetical protein